MAKEHKVTPLRPTEAAEGRPSIRMTNDRILVRRPGSEEKKTRAGLLIPATAADNGKRLVWAEVVAVGPNVRTIVASDYVLVAAELVPFVVGVRQHLDDPRRVAADVVVGEDLHVRVGDEHDVGLEHVDF